MHISIVKTSHLSSVTNCVNFSETVELEVNIYWQVYIYLFKYIQMDYFSKTAKYDFGKSIFGQILALQDLQNRSAIHSGTTVCGTKMAPKTNGVEGGKMRRAKVSRVSEAGRGGVDAKKVSEHKHALGRKATLERRAKMQHEKCLGAQCSIGAQC